MSEVTCPACGADASGRFCSSCGATLPGGVACAGCGSEIPEGGRFCNQCGTPAAAAAARAVETAPASPAPKPAASGTAPVEGRKKPGSTLPWTIAAMALLALLIALVFPRPGDPPQGLVAPGTPQPQAAGGGFGDPGSVDLSSMTPLERANSLFNRVMQNVSSGDSAQVEFFLPMALAAYADVPALDADGHYHVAVLHLADGNPAAARESATAILAETDTHLFGLFTAAQAEAALGNSTEARGFYERFMAAFEAETAVARREYGEHSAVIPLMREEAEQALAGTP